MGLRRRGGPDFGWRWRGQRRRGRRWLTPGSIRDGRRRGFRPGADQGAGRGRWLGQRRQLHEEWRALGPGEERFAGDPTQSPKESKMKGGREEKKRP